MEEENLVLIPEEILGLLIKLCSTLNYRILSQPLGEDDAVNLAAWYLQNKGVIQVGDKNVKEV